MTKINFNVNATDRDDNLYEPVHHPAEYIICFSGQRIGARGRKTTSLDNHVSIRACEVSEFK